MSCLQLRTLLQYVTSQDYRDVKFAYTGGRLFISYVDAGGNQFHRSFGTDGHFIEYESKVISISTY